MPDPVKTDKTGVDLCHTIFYFDEIGSTNRLAKKFVEKQAQIGVAIVAATQTAGKGYKDDFWESPRGGLWASLAIRPEIELRYIGLVPIIAAVGIARALQNFEITPLLKWPNDLLVTSNHKKLGGIIVESSVTQFSLNYLIIGFGLNLNTRLNQYSRSLRDRVTSTLEELQREIPLDELLLEIIKKTVGGIDELKTHGVQALLDAWKGFPNILGMKVQVLTRDQDYEGTAIGLGKYGHLILKTPESQEVALSNGTVMLL
ncbi:MAG: biotin--[acetyl-CoA-carboxylase] ligase [Candidatus Heimdallarchaeota archaeon]